jgi:hypothetical protein
MRLSITRYKFSTNPSLVPLTDAPALQPDLDSDIIVAAADFDPDDEEITIEALSEDWNGHQAGDLVVHGMTVDGHPFAVVAIATAGSVTIRDLLPELSWCYDESADTTETRGEPPKTYDGYDMGYYFDGVDIDEVYDSRKQAVQAMRDAYRGPDIGGVGLTLQDLGPGLL